MPCASSCLNCIISATTCTSCVSGKVFFNSTCLDSCHTGYYADASFICQLCSYPCETCSSGNLCLSCLDRYLLNGACLVDCPSGYFENNQGLICTACVTGCSQCVNTAAYCTLCANGHYLFNNTCVNNCPPQYYPNATLGQCLGCAGLCYTCLNAIYCLTCSANFLLNGTCVANSQCQQGNYADMKTLSCLPCSSPCLSCEFAPNYCTSCSPASSTPYLLNNTCVASCISSYFYASTVNALPACVSCSAPC
jgi:proprotein convertase subtilisin/kexin type 5